MRRAGKIRNILGLVLTVAIIALAVGLGPAGVPWRNRVFYRVPTSEKVIALTFDDGPHPVFTPQILKVLARYKVKATFFMIGEEMEQHPEIVKAVARAGHAIGNHTYSHPFIESETSKQLAREMDRCEQDIQKMTGRHADLFRAPRGELTGALLSVATAKGYKIIMWSVCADHHDAPTPQAMADRVVRMADPGGIILAHDGTYGTRWKDVRATPLIIEALRKKGYRFVTVPELIAVGQKT